jgi:protein NrfD
MSLWSVVFLSLTHLGVGVAFTLLLVSSQAGVKFFRFNAGLAAVLLAIGAAFHPPEASGWGLAGRVSQLGLAVAVAALVIYWVTIGRGLRIIRPILLPAALAGGAAAIVAQAVAVSAQAPGLPSLTIASFLASAGLLGGACTAMVLGHWYLVLPSLDVSHLQSMTKFHIASTIVRTLTVIVTVVLVLQLWDPEATRMFRRYVFTSAGVFFWQRILFGLAGPLVLSYLTWETAKIRSTQSATGILYVDFFTVVVGEVLAKYLLLATTVPV